MAPRKMVKDFRQTALSAIRKKLIGKKLSFSEYYAIIDEIAHGGIGDIITTYFAAAGFTKGFTNEELYYLTRAMVETGEKLDFPGMVADKHSVGGIPGYRTTPVVVPIIASAGIKIPKTSSRAITSPAGTADVMEVLAKVSYSPSQIKKIVQKVGGCLVWGGVVHLAPADDEIIEVGRALSFESYEKVVASVMAKKIAAGATHLVIDVPFGSEAKVKTKADADFLEEKVRFIAQKFNIQVVVEKAAINWPIGQGIGPLLEARDCLRVLEQKENRPRELEKRALKLASSLLKLCGREESLAKRLLQSGQAHQKMKEIIAAQEGDPKKGSGQLKLAPHYWSWKSQKKGKIRGFFNRNISLVCRELGSPVDKRAGIYLHKKRQEEVEEGEVLLTLYSSDKMRLRKAKERLQKGLKICKIALDAIKWG